VPALDHLPAPAALAKVPAVEMFVDRWRESHPTFKLTAEHARAVAEVCVGLEGLPLALELATAQPGPATPAAVLSGLGAVLDLAAPRLRDVPGRQRSLRATQEWSYGLLDAEQRALFRSLGVFVGGFNLDAACAVAHAHRGEDFPVGTALDALCESHLVRVETFPGDEVRYSMLEPVRQYAVDRLVTADEDVDARASHAAFFTAMAESDESRLWDHRQLEWLDTLERELPNFRAALAWCRSPAGDPSLGLRLAVAMRRYWDMRGHVAESHDHLRAFLDAVPAETPARIYGLVEIGLAATRDEDVETTTALCNEALHLAEGIDDASGISVALSGLSLAAFFQGDMATAADLATRSLVAARLVDDRPTLANALMIRAVAAMGTGDLSGAELLLDDSLRVAGGLGDRWLRAEALVVLGNLRYVRGDAAGARVAYIDSLKPHAELGNRAGLATSLKLVGSVMAEAGELKRAAQLLGAGESLAEATGATWPASWPISCDTAVSTLRSRLSEAHYASATRAGRELPLQSAIMLAAMPAESNNDEPIGGLARRQSPGGLSAREHDVALLIAQGRTNREIARTLTIAKRTADTHVERIMAKLDVHSRAEVAAWVQAPR
jgi:non-specific serine/threonine protein kinase